MNTTFSADFVSSLKKNLSPFNQKFLKTYSGESTDRQPVHTVYGGAHLFKQDTARKMGDIALHALREYAPNPTVLAKCLGLGHKLGREVYARILTKLEREPIEDFRIDFEDGYGNRADNEEDGHAVSAAGEVVKGMADASLPPFIGIRIKPFTDELVDRSLRTLDLFLTAMVSSSQMKIAKGFIITLPKVTVSEQVSTLVEALETFESKCRIPSIPIELMVETPQSLFGETGECALPALLKAARGRCRGAHFGTYDYTAASNIVAIYQNMMHSSCDFARQVMKISFSGTPVMLSDGATNVMPVGPHKALPGKKLSSSQKKENVMAVHQAWKLSYDHIRHSLENAYYQGWDLHPAQLPIRYAAIYSFFLEGLETSSERLKGFMEKAARSTLLGSVFDDAATGQGLLNYFLRGLSSGAITEDEALKTGLSIQEIRLRSFSKILELRKKA